ncbi:MAG: hypothetical protein JXR77_13410 [Lentisphaeria bacterium]|nr:hypothetical protein [Lentisphaeria bacterium]
MRRFLHPCRLLSALLLWVCATLPARAAEVTLYELDPAQPESSLRSVWHYYGDRRPGLDHGRPGPSGRPSLRLDMTVPTKTILGTPLAVRPGQWVRVELTGAAELDECESLNVAVKCRLETGTDVWLPVGRFPAGAEFTVLRGDPMEVPQSTARAYLYVFPVNARGRLWIGAAKVVSIPSPMDRLAGFRAAGPTQWGINDPLALAYHSPRDPTVSDTCAKLLAAAGLENVRVWCWWGREDQLRQNLNGVGEWVLLGRPDAPHDVSRLQERLDALAYYGLSPGVVIVHGVPDWVSGKTVDDLPDEERRDWRRRRRPFWPPPDWDALERMVETLVRQFRDRIHTWEVMNEPNTPDSGLQGGLPVYAEYLRRFRAAAKRADPDCVVLCGRIGTEWLDRVLAEDPGLLASVDGIVCHPYSSAGPGSKSLLLALALRLADAGVHDKPIYTTEVNFFGGKWRDDGPPDAVQADMADKMREGLPLVAEWSPLVYWWTAAFGTHTHGLLHDDGVCLRPLLQYRVFADLLGRLPNGGGPVRAVVEAPRVLETDQPASVTLTAVNTSVRPQRVRFWPLGLVAALGGTADGVRAHDWQGTLDPGERHTAELPIRATAAARGRDLPLGLAILCREGNSLTLTDVRVPGE